MQRYLNTIVLVVGMLYDEDDDNEEKEKEKEKEKKKEKEDSKEEGIYIWNISFVHNRKTNLLNLVNENTFSEKDLLAQISYILHVRIWKWDRKNSQGSKGIRQWPIKWWCTKLSIYIFAFSGLNSLTL